MATRADKGRHSLAEVTCLSPAEQRDNPAIDVVGVPVKSWQAAIKSYSDPECPVNSGSTGMPLDHLLESSDNQPSRLTRNSATAG